MYLALVSIRIQNSLKIPILLIILSIFFFTGCGKNDSIKKSEIRSLRLINSTISKDIKKSGELGEPVSATREFTPEDEKVVSHISFAHLSGRHELRWEWYTPEGELYQSTGDRTLNAPEGKHVKEGTACHAIALKDRNAALHPGNWQVKIYLDNALVATNTFFIHPPKIDPAFEDIEGIDFGNYYALVIGINNYTELKKLKSARNDAQKVAEVLEKKYDFKVTLLLDATRSDIIDALDQIRLNLTKEDNLLIYYAGHGILDKDADEGYWLPVDADPDRTLNWVSNSDITAKIKATAAKHVLVVADSCYAGKLVRDIHSPFSRGVIVNKKRSYYEAMTAKRTRSVMCSGGLEPVVDSGGKSGHSVFASAFIDVLKDNQGVLDGTQLFSRLRRPVVLNSDQTPEYSDIRKAGHDGGDFLFVSHHLFEKEP